MFDLNAAPLTPAQLEAERAKLRGRQARLRKDQWVAAGAAAAGILCLELFGWTEVLSASGTGYGLLIALGALGGILFAAAKSPRGTWLSALLCAAITLRGLLLANSYAAELPDDGDQAAFAIITAITCIIMQVVGMGLSLPFTTMSVTQIKILRRRLSEAGNDDEIWNDARDACRLDPVCDRYRREILAQGRPLVRGELVAMVQRAQKAILLDRANQKIVRQTLAIEQMGADTALSGDHH